MRNYWLFKTEPVTFGWDRLERDRRTEWSGVRSYQARNNMLEMKLDDLGFFYHSSTKEPGIVGIVRVVREAYPDFTAFQRGGPYYDPKSTPAHPIWQMVDVEVERALPRFVSLAELRRNAALAATMVLLKRGSRLSVQPVHVREWDIILALSEKPAPAA
ncbi:MAG TPA: EVE domain-containing protein [Candidatus Baltobacteraceae bacterium]|nr:EVE domain-containing protein [Candidatus Baltobacteraceae bacterium]